MDKLNGSLGYRGFMGMRAAKILDSFLGALSGRIILHEGLC